MTRFVLVPHIAGWGHRIRCDILGSSLMSTDHVTDVTLLVRSDDPVRPSEWTAVPSTRSALGRTWSILRASVLIEDGLAFADLRVRLMKRLGGRLVLIVQPWGFSSDAEVRKTMRMSDMILVPFPPILFDPDPLLNEFAEKVQVIPPISSVGLVRRAPSKSSVSVYCTITRPGPGLGLLLNRTEEILRVRLSKPVAFEGGFGKLKSRDDHLGALARAHVVLTQGMTSAFEAIRLGIPVVAMPRPEVPEQVETAKALVGAKLAEAVFDFPPTAEILAGAIEVAIERAKETQLPPWESGEREAIARLGSMASFWPLGEPQGPQLSVIATNYNCAHALNDHLQSIYDQFDESEFEYVVVDNHSTDRSIEILRRWSAEHRNFRWISHRCSRGRGREMAARKSKGRFLLSVDTDTVYFPRLRAFAMRAITEWPRDAVQAIHAGVLPAFLWRAVGGWGDFNIAEDFELWMRLQKMGRIKWYPVRMGENNKELYATDANDYLSSRYDRFDKLMRLFRTHYDFLRLAHYDKRLDLHEIWKQSSLNFGLGTLETRWFGESGRGTLKDRALAFGRAALHILAG